MYNKFFVVTYKVDAVNAKGEKIIDKYYQKTLQVPKTVGENNQAVLMDDAEILNEQSLNTLANQLVLEITNSLSNQQLTPEMQKAILPDWDKSSILAIGVVPLYEKIEVKKEEPNAETPSNV